jgi:two-component system chemotaxis response regulator CheY
MKCLIVEDDSAASELLKTYMSGYGDCTVAANGHEAARAVQEALKQGQHYDLICLDIRMPKMDGHDTLRAIRQMEKKHGINRPDGARVIMTTALDGYRQIREAFQAGCEAYLIKPIRKQELLEKMKELGLIKSYAN